MDPQDGINTLYAPSIAAWRAWLAEHCTTEPAIWLIVYHRDSATPSVHWHDAIEQALCFGWVDSRARKRDADSAYLRFTPRNPKSKWGKKNRARAVKLIASGQMTEHGQKLIDLAQATGRWESD